eukprot:2622603-Rhodomonas_salina.2
MSTPRCGASCTGLLLGLGHVHDDAGGACGLRSFSCQRGATGRPGLGLGRDDNDDDDDVDVVMRLGRCGSTCSGLGPGLEECTDWLQGRDAARPTSSVSALQDRHTLPTSGAM